MLSRSALIIGGTGALGRAVISVFRQDYNTVSVDLRQNNEAHSNVQISSSQSPQEQADLILNNVSGQKFDSIICTAGGWAGGAIGDDDLFDKVNHMFNVCLYPALISGHISTKLINENGLIVLTGAAAPYLDTTPTMIAYNLAKTATHSIALNLSQSDLPKDCNVVTILPKTILTPMNLQNMPDADHSQWTTPEGIAGLIKMWADGHNRPNTGAFAVLNNSNGQVVPEFV